MRAHDTTGRLREVSGGRSHACADSCFDLLRRALGHFYTDDRHDLFLVQLLIRTDRYFAVMRYPARGKWTQTVPTSLVVRMIPTVSASA